MKSILNWVMPDNIYIVGVALDICVLEAARGLRAFMDGNECDCHFKPSVWIISDAVKALDKESGIAALKEMRAMGFGDIDSMTAVI